MLIITKCFEMKYMLCANQRLTVFDTSNLDLEGTHGKAIFMSPDFIFLSNAETQLVPYIGSISWWCLCFPHNSQWMNYQKHGWLIEWLGFIEIMKLFAKPSLRGIRKGILYADWGVGENCAAYKVRPWPWPVCNIPTAITLFGIEPLLNLLPRCLM